jgi:hypothetical protein
MASPPPARSRRSGSPRSSCTTPRAHSPSREHFATSLRGRRHHNPRQALAQVNDAHNDALPDCSLREHRALTMVRAADELPTRPAQQRRTSFRISTLGCTATVRAHPETAEHRELSTESAQNSRTLGCLEARATRRTEKEAIASPTPLSMVREPAGMVKWYHTSLPSSWCGFDSRYPLQKLQKTCKVGASARPKPIEIKRFLDSAPQPSKLLVRVRFPLPAPRRPSGP